MWGLWILLAAQIQIGGELLEVEIADTETARRRGLMRRTSLSEDAGMLFVYEKPQILCFWMKQTPIPLAVGFFDKDRKLFQVEEMTPSPLPSSNLPLYESKRPAQYALEVSAGWFDRHKIEPGTTFEFKNREP